MSSSDTWHLLTGRQFLDAWPKLLPLFLRALSVHDGSYDENDMAAYILSGQWLLWVWPTREEPRSICIAEVVQYPKLRRLHVRCIAGEWRAFMENLHMIESYAREVRCASIRALMRKGLIRRLPPEWRVLRYVNVERAL